MQMVSDVPIGAFLSGGIDSSAVVAFMAAAQRAAGQDLLDRLRRRRRPRTSTTSCPTRGGSPQLFGTDHHEILVRPDVVALLPELLWHMDEPIADTAFITTYLVSRIRAPRRDGHPVRRRRRRAVRRLPALSRQPLSGVLRPAATLDCAGAAFALGEKLPSDRHSPLLNALRLAKGFLATAGLPFEERYRSYVEVFPQDAAAAAAASRQRSDRA